MISSRIEWSSRDLFVLMLMNDCLIPILSDFGAVESIASPWRGKFVIHQPSRLSGLNKGLAGAAHGMRQPRRSKAPLTWWAVILWGRTNCSYYCRFTVRRGWGGKKHLTCTNSGEAMLVTKGLKTKHPVSAQLGKLANNVPFPLTNVWQLAFANHSLLTLWCMSWIPTGGYRRSLLTLNLPMTNGVPANVRFLGRGRGSF